MERCGLSALLEQVIQLVHEVGDQVVMPRFLKVARQHKGDGSVLTEADLAAQEALQRGLATIIDCPLVGEEMTPQAQQKAWDEGHAANGRGVWCVDPIDGTLNFASGLPQFAISVAYIADKKPQFGVVYAPALGETFYAQAGQGAFLQKNGQPTVSLPHSQQGLNTSADLAEAVAIVDFKRLPQALAQALVTHPPYHSQRNFGAATLDWCYLAAGRCDLYLHGGQMLWDYAAASLILQEAQGCMTTLDARVPFWQGDRWHSSVVAARNPVLFQTWKGWLENLSSSR